MATILRDLSYRYQWLYDGISRLAALTVGGEARFRQLALEGLSIDPEMQILDLCCGSGQATRYLVQRLAQSGKGFASNPVVGLDASPLSIQRSQKNVPEAAFVEGWAEAMPFEAEQFDLVHTSAALHEMKLDQLRQILREVHRVLKPGGVFTLIDFHQPTNPIFTPGLYGFFWLFETETAWELLKTNLVSELEAAGFVNPQQTLLAGGSLQRIQALKKQDDQEKNECKTPQNMSVPIVENQA
ncbi:class I SAM-dependent methyltransferase [Leptolyngbya sp. GB1-A1]|uniref:class I SAM-dependent methyltransferase n=1 Tax=Leptolyngbya sp. GB1-A1 TaxID=2933908 RepID=UPI003297F96B